MNFSLFKQIGLFILDNIHSILFLIGLGILVLSFFQIGKIWGLFSTAFVFLLVSLLLNPSGKGEG